MTPDEQEELQEILRKMLQRLVEAQADLDTIVLSVEQIKRALGFAPSIGSEKRGEPDPTR